MRTVSLVVLGLVVTWSLLRSNLSHATDEVEFFEKRVRPILVERCESCHSTAKGKTSGGLSLDTREDWQKGGDSGPAIVPLKLEESLLIQAVRYRDDGPQMPPKDKGGKLTEKEISTLEEWVRRGAFDPRVAVARIGGMTPEEARNWWAFRPLPAVSVPQADGEWKDGTEIDRFMHAGLRANGLSPSVPADRRTLLRRATFDLTGLPPTPEDVRAFLADHQPDAFEQVVNRLLDSPAYGERWGRHWLDVVRYTDLFVHPRDYNASFTYELHEAYRYRDWVVSAFNRDLPYDQFVVQQIAGDILPGPKGELPHLNGLAATGFLCIGSVDHGDADKDKIVSDIVDDQVDAIGKGFLGLTLACARCHDHKFDPVSTEDYYGLAGMFYSTRVLADLGAKGAATVIQRLPFAAPVEVVIRKNRETQLVSVNTQLEEWDRLRCRELAAGGTVLVPSRFTSAAGATSTIAADGSVTVGGTRVKDTYTIEAMIGAATTVRAVRLEALPDPGFPANGPGRADDGNFVVSQFSAAYLPPQSADSFSAIKFTKVRADFEQVGFPAAASLEGKPNLGWAISGRRGIEHVAIYQAEPAIEVPAGSRLSVTIAHHYADNYTLGKFRLSLLTELPPVPSDEATERLGLISSQIQLQKELSVPLPVALAVQEGGTPGSLFPTVQDVNLHIRGSHTKLGPVVKRRLPQFFAEHSQPEITGSGRLQLARWIASRDNPLTARVLVNRVWQHHFGEGIVRTPNNFGKLGETPSHPELLDWLAMKFMDEGWSIKRLHRRLMLSATYQQASLVPQDVAARDPENRWLGRMNSRRLEAEALRDAMLAASGQLDRTPGGPATADLTIRRRSLYVSTTRWDRDNFSTLFDAANPDSPVEKRTSSTVSPQALFLLNNPFVQTEAKHLAARLAAAARDDSARVQLAFELLFARLPTDREVQQALSFIAATSWDDYAHLLLCSNEFTYID